MIKPDIHVFVIALDAMHSPMFDYIFRLNLITASSGPHATSNNMSFDLRVVGYYLKSGYRYRSIGKSGYINGGRPRAHQCSSAQIENGYEPLQAHVVNEKVT